MYNYVAVHTVLTLIFMLNEEIRLLKLFLPERELL